MFSFPDLGDNTGESVALYDGVHHFLDPQLAPLHQPVQTTGQHITQQVRALPQQAIFHTMTDCSSAGQSPATTINLSHYGPLFLSRSQPCHCVRHTLFTALLTILDIYISFLLIPVPYVISSINTEDCQSSIHVY